MQEQHFKNHTRLVPVFHFAGYPLTLFIIVCGFIKLYKNYNIGRGGLLVPAVIIATGTVLLILLWFARSFALKAQDRGIRAEENLRYFAITGKLIDSKLTIGQIVALRFAPNNEFVDLAHRAVAEDMKPKDIKKAIVHWKGDHHRV